MRSPTRARPFNREARTPARAARAGNSIVFAHACGLTQTHRACTCPTTPHPAQHPAAPVRRTHCVSLCPEQSGAAAAVERAPANRIRSSSPAIRTGLQPALWQSVPARLGLLAHTAWRSQPGPRFSSLPSPLWGSRSAGKELESASRVRPCSSAPGASSFIELDGVGSVPSTVLASLAGMRMAHGHYCCTRRQLGRQRKEQPVSFDPTNVRVHTHVV